MKTLLISLNFVLLFACSTSQKNEEAIKVKTQSMGVSLEREQAVMPKPLEVKETSDQVAVGPTPSVYNANNDATNSNKKEIEPAIAMILPDVKDIIPTTLSVVRLLARSGITPRIYAGAGLGAAMATALAFNLSADEIEWELFALERKGAYAQEDKAKALVSRYDDKDISQSFHVLVLPTEKGKWVTRGSVKKVIKPHLESVGKGNWPIHNTSGSFGADIVLVINNQEAREQVDDLKTKIDAWKEQKRKMMSNGN